MGQIADSAGVASRRTVHVRACAKLNLALTIGPRREDGYHDVDTLFHSIDLHDDVIVSQGSSEDPLVIVCERANVPLDERNLVWQAAEALQGALGRRSVRGVSITLVKRIPMQAGLGGGSADAAATLKALATIWGSRMSLDQLHDVAAALGADVPFFLHGGAARGRGRGDELTLLPDQSTAWATIVVPAFGVSTADAYRWLDEDRTSDRHSARAPELAAVVERPLYNDLEAPVFKRHPQLAEIKQSLEYGGAIGAAMTGSGSAVFGLYSDEASAHMASRQLKMRAEEIIVTRLIGRDVYAAFAAPRVLSEPDAS